LTAAAAILELQGSVANQALNATQRVTQAIRQASAKAGVDFAYMLNKASQESSLNPTAKSSSSSATGLFQFIEQTWLRTVKTYGEKYGLGDYASRIAIGADGVARVTDSQCKKAILDMRKDPSLSACMAAELTNENKSALQGEVGGKIGATELYLAHFLGAGGAAGFLKAMRANPNATAADVLPSAASANPSVFYDKAGQACSLSQIYNRFAAKFEKTPAIACPTAIADASETFSAPSVIRAPSSGFTSPFTYPANLGPSMDSTIATMILAQTGFGDMTPYATETNAREEKDKKASFFSTSGIYG